MGRGWFIGNLIDQSGNGNNGVLDGAELSEDIYGDLNGSYRFDENLISLDDLDVMDGLQEMSISVWFNADVITALNGFGHGASSRGNIIIAKGGSEGDDSWGIDLGQNDKISFYIDNGADQVLTSIGTIVSDQWYHVLVVYDGLNQYLYLNGALNNQRTTTGGNVISNSLPIRIGNNDVSSSFKGRIDDLSLYNKAVDSNEVLELFNRGVLPVPTSEKICENLYCVGDNIGIGTTNTYGYRLAVDGKALMEEVKVQLSENWPDYVFAKDYDLKSLNEVAAYIKENGHLPNIPSAETVSREGISLGQMNARLLEKIEELTLHTISQEKKMTQQSNQLKDQQKQIDLLIHRLEKLEN